jgi:shikimate kinase
MAAAIAIIGFMGAGKSRIGMALAHRLRLPFVDTDALIVEQLGPIERIFAEQGEAAFRALEQDVVTAVLEKAQRMACVVALGGGAVTSAGVRSVLSAMPHVVWLTAAPDTLFARAAGGGRPLAADQAEFERLFEERRSLYSELATARVANSGDRQIEDVVDDVLRGCAIETPGTARDRGERR